MITGKSFDKVVRDPTKDVLVNVSDYSNTVSMGISREFALFAKVLKDVPDLVFAEMDASMNEARDINYDKLPTIGLFTKEGTQYQNGIVMPSFDDEPEKHNEYHRKFLDHLLKNSSSYQKYCLDHKECDGHEKQLIDGMNEDGFEAEDQPEANQESNSNFE